MGKASAAWGAVLAGSVLFFIIAFSITAFGSYGIPSGARFLAIAFAGFALLAYVQKEHGAKAAAAGGALGILFFYAAVQEPYAPTAILSLTMLAAPFWWLGRKGKNTGKALAELGITGKKWAREALLGVPLTLAVLLMLLLLFQLYTALGIADSDQVMGAIRGVPFYILLLAVAINPFTEEIFFRGFLVPRIGVLPAAAIFGLSHLSYGSVAEVVSVFFIGLLFGIVFEKRRSLLPVVVSHIIINSAAVYLMRFAV